MNTAAFQSVSAVLLAAIVTACSVAHAKEHTLPRSTLLGIMPAQTSQGEPVVLQRIVPRSTASAIGLKAGDTLVSINQQPIGEFSDVLDTIRPLTTGQEVSVTLQRDGKTLTVSGEMHPRPFEESAHAEVLYESVSYTGNVLRSITYKPATASLQTKAPAIFFIQGYTCGSIDMGMMPNATTKQLVEQFAKAGYVVFRAEKPGVGDSQSDQHCADIDFTTETTAFIEALRALKQKPYVDTNHIYLWGHSLGVLHAPVVASNEPVAGIIGYGGVLKPWYDYMLDIYYEQSVKHFNASPSQARRNKAIMQPVLDMWLNSDAPWSDVKTHKATQAAVDAGLVSIRDTQIFDRHYSFFRDLNQYDFASMWQQLDVPLLMMHGSLDIQAIDKKWAFDLVSLSSHPQSQALEVEGAEHAFMLYASASDYRQAQAQGTFNPAEPDGHYDPRLVEHSLNWLAALQTGKN
ncbi:PDZ domain-containing protein [Aestuariibacter salexigens]|uniref:PDZ domain-containing protein n=1 Tax=Aestuariibacter salexigens TaxID=226010 RepID=UPI0003F96840|nr:PDZ domain-containing protein [Aestuariibacter salexigens]